MARPRKLKFPDENPDEPKVRKPRKFRPGGVRTKQRIRKAQAKHPIPNAVMRRMIAEASEGKVRWSKAALNLLVEVVHADVQQTLVVTKATMVHANKKVLNARHMMLAEAIVSEVGGGLCA